MTDKILKVQELKKSYDGFVAVNGISFHVNRAEIFGFLFEKTVLLIIF